MVSKISKSLVTTIQATTFIMVYIMGPTIVQIPHLKLGNNEGIILWVHKSITDT